MPYQTPDPEFSMENLPKDFIRAITEAQISANKGAASLVDERVVSCPECNSPGMNTCLGYWAFTCGAELMPDGDMTEPCQAAYDAANSA